MKIKENTPPKKKYNVPYHHLTKLRIFFILVILIEELIYWYNLHIKDAVYGKVFFLTEWAHFFTFIFYFSMVIKQYDKEKTHKFSFIFHLALSLQFLIVIIYWGFLHKIAIKRIEFDNIIYILYTKHILPPIFLLIDLFLNNVVLKNTRKKHFYFIALYGGYLMFISFYFETNIYPIFTFDDVKTFICLLVCCLLLLIFENVVLRIQEYKFVQKKQLKVK